jgi:hypothetical protein
VRPVAAAITARFPITSTSTDRHRICTDNMRVVLIACLALVLLVASTVAKQTFGEQSQEDVKNFRWANCSTIIHGRLGDLHKFNDDSWHMVRQTTEYYFAYSPCMLKNFADLTTMGDASNLGLFGWTADVLKEAVMDQPDVTESTGFHFILLHRDADGQVHRRALQTEAPDASSVPDNKLVEFHMPESKGDVPKFTATYTYTPKTLVKYTATTTITSSCGLDTSILDVDGTSTNFVLNVQTLQACARFPYTNEAMPAGGIAALVVILVLFAIQFSICGWYHATHKLEANPADRTH